MKKLLTLVLVGLCVLLLGSSTLAAPPAGEQGSIVAYGEYGNFYGEFAVGAGYTVSDGIAIGAVFYPTSSMFGGFASISTDAVDANAEVLFDSGAFIGTAAATYMFDLDAIKLGAGGGLFFVGGGGLFGATFFAEGAVTMAASENLSLYATLDYYIEAQLTAYKVGVACSF